MALEKVVVCSGGLRLAQRGADVPVDGPALRATTTPAVALPDFPPVEARRADNVVWRRHWLGLDRLVIEFVDLAVVEVDHTSGTIAFDRNLPTEMEQHLLFDHVLPLVLARDGALVVHGAVISRGGKGAVLVGATGAGKSTITAFAWQRGWSVGGDDGAVLFATEPPAVEPTYSTVRVTPASADLLGIDVKATSAVAGKRRLAGEGTRAFSPERVELHLVAIIQPTESAVAQFEQVDALDAHAQLFGSTFHAELSGGPLLGSTVDRLASIVERTRVGRLSVPRGLDGLRAAERLLRALIDGDEDGSADE